MSERIFSLESFDKEKNPWLVRFIEERYRETSAEIARLMARQAEFVRLLGYTPQPEPHPPASEL